jgi:hypothetical protein
MRKQCIISLGVGQRFALGLERLRAGIEFHGFEGDVHLFDHYPEGIPAHEEIPYGFKPHLFDWAAKQGYESILWCDSACVPVKPMAPIWRALERQGYQLQRSPNNQGMWIGDSCLEIMGLTRKKAMGMVPSVWATVLGLNMRNKTARKFLSQWIEAAEKGAFHGPWTNESGEASTDPRVHGHRHDQSVAGILAFRLNMLFDWDIVFYDVYETMPLKDWEGKFSQPGFPAVFLSNHNVKTQRCSTT